MFSVAVTPWRVEDSAPDPMVVIVVGPPSGWELQGGESKLAGHNAICPLVRYLIILVSVKPGQARTPTSGGGVTQIHAQGCGDRGCPYSSRTASPSLGRPVRVLGWLRAAVPGGKVA